MNRELFIETITAIKNQYIHDVKCAEKISECYDVFTAEAFYKNHWLQNALVKLLQVEFKDDHSHSWIEYYCWELNFGLKNNEFKATRKDGSNIPLSNASDLYDCLIEHNNV